MLRKLSIVAACLLIATGCSKQPAPVAAKPGTLAIVNARIWTGDDAQPWAQALVIDGDDARARRQRTKTLARRTPSRSSMPAAG